MEWPHTLLGNEMSADDEANATQMTFPQFGLRFHRRWLVQWIDEADFLESVANAAALSSCGGEPFGC